MQERENLESISSDGELNDFKKYTLVEQDHHMFVRKEYKELLQRKYGHDKKELMMYLSGRLHDPELEQQALQNIKEKCDVNKYFNKRILTNERQQLAPRWASDL